MESLNVSRSGQTQCNLNVGNAKMHCLRIQHIYMSQFLQGSSCKAIHIIIYTLNK